MFITPAANAPGSNRPNIKYGPFRCRFRNKEAWAILTKQVDGAWLAVNCLDKDRACEPHPCAFIVERGRWPFDPVP